MSLNEDLLTLPLREDSGARSLARYDFQALWGLALLFEQHPLQDDYAIVFELHDDIALLNSSYKPTTIRFYQVKTKSRNSWTIASLTKQEKKKSVQGRTPEKLPSIIGKMMHNIQLFPDYTESADFVSNAPCNFGPDGNQFKFTECSTNEFKKFINAIKTELPDTRKSQASLIGYIQTDLSLNDSSGHIQGKLNRFVTDQLGSISFNLDALYTTIVDECRRKSKHSGSFGTLTDLIKEKGISRRNVVEWLNAVKQNVECPSWDEISSELTCTFAEKMKLRDQWMLYRSAVLNSSDEAIRRVRRAVRKKLSEYSDNGETLSEIIEQVYQDTHKSGMENLKPYKPERMKVMIIYEIYANDKT